MCEHPEVTVTTSTEWAALSKHYLYPSSGSSMGRVGLLLRPRFLTQASPASGGYWKFLGFSSSFRCSPWVSAQSLLLVRTPSYWARAYLYELHLQ